MTKKELLKQIYTLGFNRKVKLNIQKHNYILKDMWNIDDGILVSIYNKNGMKTKYVDNLSLVDKMLIYKKLLRFDIYKKLKKSYPQMNIKEIVKMTDMLQKNILKNKKVFHRNG
jgi:hypothetical protein